MTVLFIVESPKKRATIRKHLGPNYDVVATVGHFRDLPVKPEQIPERYKNESWARLGINIDDDFKLLYVVPPEKQNVLKELKDGAKKADRIVIATDLDREGEGIAAHVIDALGLKDKEYERITFAEITKEAIQEALKHPRKVDRDLVNAQETRRTIDRLYGYLMSPPLWNNIGPGMSAGRVQSVTTRIIVELERARMRFHSASYGGAEAVLSIGESQATTTLRQLGGNKLATGKDFDPLSGMVRSGALLLDPQRAAEIAADTQETGELRVVGIEKKPWRRSPPVPFITSTLGREAGRRFKWDLKKATKVAQGLYEKGMISYIRTDSPSLSDEATQAARQAVEEKFGAAALPTKPRNYAAKGKGAQEAHEAIRPSGQVFQLPSSLGSELDADEIKLYTLIYERTLASQMIDAVGESTSVTLEGESQGEVTTWALSGRVISEPGFLKLFDDTPEGEGEDGGEQALPALEEQQMVQVTSARATESRTKPPARLDEAALVGKLEADGLGRPSTFSSMVSLIQDREYVIKEKGKLIPSWKGHAVVCALEQMAPRLVDLGFTASMEEELDEIAAGRMDKLAYLTNFYGGEEGIGAISTTASSQRGNNPIIDVPQLDLGGALIRYASSGAYLERAGRKVMLPEGVLPHDLTAAHLAEAERAGRVVPEAEQRSGSPAVILGMYEGHKVYSRSGQYGPYVQLGERKGDEKPLVRNVSPEHHEEMTLDLAVQYLTGELRHFKDRPSLGEDPETGSKIYVFDGQYGPYVQLGEGKDARRVNVTKEDHAAGIDLARALKYLSGEISSVPSLGIDPESGQRVYLREGQYGPYVQLGEGKGKDAHYANIPPDEVKKLKLERALLHLKAQRSLGTSGGEEIKLALGKNGYYLKQGSEFRDTTAEEAASMTLEQALEKLRSPRAPRNWDAASSKPSSKSASPARKSTGGGRKV